MLEGLVVDKGKCKRSVLRAFLDPLVCNMDMDVGLGTQKKK